jgi:hypothetical protein
VRSSHEISYRNEKNVLLVKLVSRRLPSPGSAFCGEDLVCWVLSLIGSVQSDGAYVRFVSRVMVLWAWFLNPV